MTLAEAIEFALNQDPQIVPARFWMGVGMVIGNRALRHASPDLMTTLLLANRGEPPDFAAAVIALKNLQGRVKELRERAER